MIGPWLKISGAAKYMGDVSVRKVREWVASGRLKHRRVDGVLYFATEWLDEFMIHKGTEDEIKAGNIDDIVNEVVRGLG